jgi:hypothetical protein
LFLNLFPLPILPLEFGCSICSLLLLLFLFIAICSHFRISDWLVTALCSYIPCDLQPYRIRVDWGTPRVKRVQ